MSYGTKREHEMWRRKRMICPNKESRMMKQNRINNKCMRQLIIHYYYWSRTKFDIFISEEFAFVVNQTTTGMSLFIVHADEKRKNQNKNEFSIFSRLPCMIFRFQFPFSS